MNPYNYVTFCSTTFTLLLICLMSKPTLENSSRGSDVICLFLLELLLSTCHYHFIHE